MTSIKFGLAEGTVVHKSAGMVRVAATFNSTTGLRSASISGGYSGGASNFNPPVKESVLTIDWHVAYFPTGKYKFTAEATDVAAAPTQASITLILEA